MQNIVCSGCEEIFDSKDIIKVKEGSGTAMPVCGGCRPDLADEIEAIKNNNKLKLANPPVKKVS